MECWGISTAIDLYNCDPVSIRSKQIITDYVNKLVKLIDMNKFGDVQIVNFGEDPKVSGFTMIQMIETSLISAHFANQSNSAYIDIFSCKPYNAPRAVYFTKKFFGATKFGYRKIKRGKLIS